MDYEQRHKEVLDAIKKLQEANPSNDGIQNWVNENFPELAESEDEKIRKELIEKVKETPACIGFNDKNAVLAWLEKQVKRDARYENLEELLESDAIYQMAMNDTMVEEAKTKAMNALSELEIGKLLGIEKQAEQKSIINVPPREVILAIWDLGNEWKELTNGCISTEYGTQLDYIQKHWHESEYYLKEKQCEKKSADKVGPKFKVGDWVVTGYGKVNQIIAVDEDNDGFTLDDDTYFSGSWKDSYHLWSIEDAKDGDVLAVEPIDDYQFPFIAIYENRGLNFFNSYCSMGFDGKFYEATTGHALDNLYPATKEQRDLLSQKMREAGYGWNPQKKELKKIDYRGNGWQQYLHGEEVDMAQWAKEHSAELLETTNQNYVAWSEEDENNINSIVSRLEVDISYWESRSKTRANEDEKLINWLKSLKQKIGWEPTKEQIIALRWTLNNIPYNKHKEEISGLLEELKKL